MDAQFHFGFIGQKLRVILRNGIDVQEYIPTESLEKDFPSVLSVDHRFWYSSKNRSIEIRRPSQAWANDDKPHWTVYLETSTSVLSGRVRKGTTFGSKSLVNPSSQAYRALVKTLAPLEPDSRAFLITVSDEDTSRIFAYLPRHDLTFSLHLNNLACLSLPGYVVEPDLSGIGCLFGLTSILSLRHHDSQQLARKVIVPKGSLVVRPGQHGHTSTSIHVGESRGYFVYDVDEVLGRLVGTHTMESDLYLAKLHAFTASCLPDPLTQRTGTIEALDRLTSAACISFHAISKESQSYLEDMKTLTPKRSFYPAHLRLMETVEWNQHLPVCVQHPEFRSRVKNIESSWRDMEMFLPKGQLNKIVDSSGESDHLNSRAMNRGWVYSTFGDTKADAVDLPYVGRDSLTDSASREREDTVFRAASCIRYQDRYSDVPVCQNLQKVVKKWNKIQGAQGWGWDSIVDWLGVPEAMPIANTWCTFYELCRKSQASSFDMCVALAFQSFRGVPLNLISVLGNVIHDSSFSSPTFSCPSFSSLELDKGWAFHRETILNLVQMNAKPFKETEEYYIAPEPSESEINRVARAQGLYRAALRREAEDLVDLFDSHWPTIPADFNLMTLQIIDLPRTVIKSTIEPTLTIWKQNKDFLEHIKSVQDQLTRRQIFLPPPDGYKPQHHGYTRQHPITTKARAFKQFTLETLMKDRRPDPMDASTTTPLYMSPNPPHTREEVGGMLSLLERLGGIPRNRLETEYLNNLRASWAAFRSQSSETSPNHFHPSVLEFLQSSSLKHCQLYLKQIRRCLQPNTRADEMMQLVGMWPIITTQELLRSLSLRRRVSLPQSWIPCLIGYAVSIHDSKRTSRMLQLARDDMKTQLEKELGYFRAWQPMEHPDWLLVEIESNISIRPAQAAIADRMLNPNGNQNAVMQLNMGEGKSSVSQILVGLTNILMPLSR